MEPRDAIRVVIADDQAMVRAGLRMVLESEADMRVVGEAGDGVDAVAVARRTTPDIVLMDIQMPRMDGLGATTELLSRPSPPKVIVLTTFDSDDNLYAALRAGVSGFLLKVSPPEQLVDGVRVVAAGEALLDPAVTTRVIASFAGRHDPVPPPRLGLLTPRELEVLGLLARGHSNAEIARTLFVGEATVKTHVARVLMKLHLRDRAQAVVFAYEAGVVRPGASG
ncbi:DNA-binding response regulator [Spongiactinospora gelatinilytica]|uniref:DNA-binding response regulator n=1 Tax=Spongiactinospora gelatinilytica TaxID=2666298 RepID=A0A2W2HKW1_9ACTN|nr:response regulator transcription factor [Spongiactinospora gelatinilytica]PZG39634.1 DNA-binding response regulator [Spongiactinospora gelatinilytica]